jgi:hypothetical protein
MLNFLAMTVPGLVVGYVLFLRPVLRALPQFKAFYAQADGFWQTVWALCGKSTTLAVSAGVQVVGMALQMIDPVASLLGDPDLKQTIADALQTNPKVLGWVMMFISAITIAARLRGLAKG